MNRCHLCTTLACLSLGLAGVTFVGAATTAPVGPQSPKAAALALIPAVKTGDLATVLACYVTDTDDQKLAAERIMLEVLPWAAIEKSLKAKFGPETRIDYSDNDFYSSQAARIEAGMAVVEGDKAKFYLGTPGKPPVGMTGRADIEMVRTAGGWKLDASNTVFDHMEKDLERPRLRYALAREIAADIAGGKFSNAKDAVKNARERFQAQDNSFANSAK